MCFSNDYFADVNPLAANDDPIIFSAIELLLDVLYVYS